MLDFWNVSVDLVVQHMDLDVNMSLNGYASIVRTIVLADIQNAEIDRNHLKGLLEKRRSIAL